MDKRNEILYSVIEAISSLLRGKKPKQINVSASDLNRDPVCKALCNTTNKLIQTLEESIEFTSTLADGNLEVVAPPGNLFISYIKKLQATLKLLTWQAKQVAKGDYNQRVDFMGDFAYSINSMIAAFQAKEKAEEALQKAHDELETRVAERTSELSQAYEKLKVEIEDRKRTEAKLRESEEKFRGITISAQEAIILMDNDGKISYWNPSAEKIFGYANEAAVGCYVHDLLIPQFYHEVYRKELEDFKENGSGPFIGKVIELTALKNNSTEFPIELSVSSIKIKDKWNAIGIVRDISARKVAEGEYGKLQEQLLQSQKMEALGDLAGGIAHDFNNILAAIMSYTEVALHDISDDNEIRKFLEPILSSTHRARDLVKRILAFSRRNKIERKPIQIHNIVNEVYKLMKATLPSTIEIRQNILTKANVVLADQTQIHQICMNLCTNAYHAMQENGGTLVISLDSVSFDSHQELPSQDLKPGNYIVLTISDTGKGIPVENQDRIFEPYFTTKKQGDGTGLGLSIVHGIVKSHEGDITLNSVQGKGTAFSIYLPMAEIINIEDGASTRKMIKGVGRILFVDDEQALVDASKHILTRAGFEVAGYSCSIEALEEFKKQPEAFDLIFTDMTMPKMTGDIFVEKIKEIRPEMPIILCTGYSDAITEEKAKIMGITELIIKPIEMFDLVQAIRHVLENRLAA